MYVCKINPLSHLCDSFVFRMMQAHLSKGAVREARHVSTQICSGSGIPQKTSGRVVSGGEFFFSWEILFAHYACSIALGK